MFALAAGPFLCFVEWFGSLRAAGAFLCFVERFCSPGGWRGLSGGGRVPFASGSEALFVGGRVPFAHTLFIHGAALTANVSGARRRAPPTRSRSPVTIDEHRCPKRTERFHPTKKPPLQKRTEPFHRPKGPASPANRTFPPTNKAPLPKRPHEKGPHSGAPSNAGNAKNPTSVGPK